MIQARGQALLDFGAPQPAPMPAQSIDKESPSSCHKVLESHLLGPVLPQDAPLLLQLLGFLDFRCNRPHLLAVTKGDTNEKKRFRRDRVENAALHCSR